MSNNKATGIDTVTPLWDSIMAAPDSRARAKIIGKIEDVDLVRAIMSMAAAFEDDARKASLWNSLRKYRSIYKYAEGRFAKLKPAEVDAAPSLPVKRTKAVSDAEWRAAMDEYEGSLVDSITYTGQYKAARNMLIKEGKYTPEAIAGMTDDDVLRCIQHDWKLVAVEPEHILLVRRDKVDVFNEISWTLGR